MISSLFNQIFGLKKEEEDPEQAWIQRFRSNSRLWSALTRPVSDGRRNILCCPLSSSLMVVDTSHVSDSDFLSAHVLEPETHNTNGVDTYSTKFQTLGEHRVQIEGNDLVCASDIDSGSVRRVRLLGVTEQSFEGYAFQIWTISHPLLGGLELESTAEQEQRNVSRQVALLRSYPQLDSIFSEIDEFVKDITQLASASIPVCPMLFTGYDATNSFGPNEVSHPFSMVKPSFQRCVHAFFSKTLGRLRQYFGDRAASNSYSSPLDSTNLELLLESYIFIGIGACTHAWILDSNRIDNDACRLFEEALLRIKSDVRDQAQHALTIPESFRCDQNAAVMQLCGLASELTPTRKLACLGRVVTLVQCSVEHHLHKTGHDSLEGLCTDDLLQILAFVVANAAPKYKDLATDLQYIEEFHCAANATSSSDEMALCHFQVVLAWMRGKCDGAM